MSSNEENKLSHELQKLKSQHINISPKKQGSFTNEELDKVRNKLVDLSSEGFEMSRTIIRFKLYEELFMKKEVKEELDNLVSKMFDSEQQRQTSTPDSSKLSIVKKEKVALRKKRVNNRTARRVKSYYPPRRTSELRNTNRTSGKSVALESPAKSNKNDQFSEYF